jgi:hypothetical protein
MSRTRLRPAFRAGGAGLALVALYVVVAVATASTGPGRLRPLFDGFGTHPGEYSWVKPPKEFAEGNRPPDSAQARIALGAGGSSPVVAETPDGQVMVSLPQGAVPPHQSDSAATLEVRPYDGTSLGPLPAGLRPEGNAYKVTIAYLSSKAEVATVTVPGKVGVTGEVQPGTLLFSPDGRGWRPVEAQPLAAPGKGFTATFTEAGYYLPAGPGEPRPVASSGGSPVALFVVAAAVPLILGYLLLVRRRPAGSSDDRRPAARRPPPKKKKTSTTNKKKKRR